MFRQEPLSDQIAQHVRDAIMAGEYEPGALLPIDQLAKSFQVSATPIREALLSLRAEGFVDFEPRRGFRATVLTAPDVGDLYLVQALIAGELAARAAHRITPADLDRLETLQAQMKKAAGRKAYTEVDELNYRFHRIINHASGSRKLGWLLGLVLRYTPQHFYEVVPGWLEASLDDHIKIIAALRAADDEASRAAMDSHIEHAGRLVVSHFEAKGVFGAPPESSAAI